PVRLLRNLFRLLRYFAGPSLTKQIIRSTDTCSFTRDVASQKEGDHAASGNAEVLIAGVLPVTRDARSQRAVYSEEPCPRIELTGPRWFCGGIYAPSRRRRSRSPTA